MLKSVQLPSTRAIALSIPPAIATIYLIYKISQSPKKKRTHSRAAPSEGSEVSVSATEEEDEEDEGERPRYEYYCMFRPFFDIENENESKDENDQVDEDSLIDNYERYIRSDNIEMKPAVEHPEHRWIAMWETWKVFSYFERRASFTNPDFFKMHIYKDFHGEGLQEVVENMLITFDKAFSKKRRDENTLKQMWAIIAAFMQWFTEIPHDAWLSLRDRQKLGTTLGLIGRALVSVLNEFDQAKLLKADSDIKDLGLVITFYLYWGGDLKERGLELPFRKEAIAYAKKAGIDLKEAGCHGTDERVKELEKENGGKIKSLSGKAQADRWDWKKKFRKFSKDYKVGGEKYNILRMTRDERASYAWDKKDPLAQISDKDLLEGNVRVRPKRG